MTAAAVVIGSMLVADHASAQSCPDSLRPVVELVLEVDPPDILIARAVEERLRSELTVRDIDVCTTSAAPRKSIAQVHLRVDHPTHGPIVAMITVGDAVTDKRVERKVNLSKLPRDSRPLAVATATDELLRASWAELEIADAPPPAMPPPPAVTRAVASSLRAKPAAPAGPRPFELGVIGVVSSFPSHREAVGFGVLGGYWFHPRFVATFRITGNGGLSRSGEHGRARVNTLEAGPAIAYSLFPRIEGLRVEAGALFTWASLDSTPNEGGLGASISDWTVTAHAGARGWVDTWRIRWTLGAGALLPFRAVTAADAGRAVTSIKGLGVEVTAGGLVRF